MRWELKIQVWPCRDDSIDVPDDIQRLAKTYALLAIMDHHCLEADTPEYLYGHLIDVHIGDARDCIFDALAAVSNAMAQRGWTCMGVRALDPGNPGSAHILTITTDPELVASSVACFGDMPADRRPTAHEAMELLADDFDGDTERLPRRLRDLATQLCRPPRRLG